MKRSLFVIFFVATSLQAQRYDERIDVDVIEVPVNVTRNGHVVRGLTQDDFELLVNGKPHPIRYFDVIDQSATAVPQRVLERRRLVVLLFDTTVTATRLLTRAKQAALQFVNEAAENDTFAVARLSRDGVYFVVPFTNDRVALRHAVTTLSPSRAGDAFSIATLPSERALMPDIAMSQQLDTSEAFLNADNSQFPIPEAAFQTESMEKERQVNELHRRDDQNTVAYILGHLADRLASISGVKHVVLLADGATGGADRGSVDVMHRKFRAAGVILDAVELDANTVPGSFGPIMRVNSPKSRFLLPENDKTASLYALAVETGGTVAKHADIASGLRSLRDMQSVTYVLGFTPPATQKKDNTITVHVRHQPFGTTVNHRLGYSTAPPGSRSDPLFLADVLMNDIPQRGLTLDLKVETSGAGATLVASIPGRELLAYRNGSPAELLDVILYVFDDKGDVAGWAYTRLRLDLDKGRDFLEANPYTIRHGFDLRGGTYAAKALLRVVGTDVAGFRRSDFAVTR